jgi:hypothetical protein
MTVASATKQTAGIFDLNHNERLALRIIKVWQLHYSNSPNVPELAEDMGVANDVASRVIQKLEEKLCVDLMYTKTGRLLIKPLQWE